MRVVFYVGLISFLFLFQNCSDVGFSSDSGPSESSSASQNGALNTPAGDAFADVLQGLKGGHFDLDTSTAVYPLGGGQTNHHVHEYDDKYNVTYADFFNLLDAKFDNIHEVVQPGTRFVLLIGNAQLSPGGVLSINGQTQSVVDYQSRVAGFIAGQTSALTVFTLDGSSGQKLSALKIGFSQSALMNGGLIGTETSCVVHNDAGKLGEYRNGALVIQAVDVNALKINPQTKTADLGSGLLWESTIFWHWSNGCYK